MRFLDFSADFSGISYTSLSISDPGVWFAKISIYMILIMMIRRARETIFLLFLAVFSKAAAFNLKPFPRRNRPSDEASYCLSWRLAVETNNIQGWRTVPIECLTHIGGYMIGGQYDLDINLIVENIINYVNGINISEDGWDAFILDVDDTCLSNIFFYKGKRFGCDPYDPQGFKAWAITGECPAVPAILRLFNHLVLNGFKVFIITGRDEETFFQATSNNLFTQGFIGYERLILRSGAYKGQSAVRYKSEIRKQLSEEGYRIWGNVGDQWSDLHGDYIGNRTFKLPNPMYFVP